MSTASRAALLRGQVWWVNLDPPTGHEQAGDRPGLVVSTNQYNQGKAGQVVIVPITKQVKVHLAGMHVEVEPPEGGLSTPSVILCDHVRSISRHRIRRFSGTVSEGVFADVEDRLRILLEL